MADDSKQSQPQVDEPKANLITTDQLEELRKGLIEEMSAKQAEILEARQKKFNLTGSEEDEFKLKKTEKRNEIVTFFKALAEDDRQTLKSMSDARAKVLSEGTNSAGGYLVPEEFDRQIIRKLNEDSQLRQYARVINMGSDVMNLSTLATDVAAAYVSEWAQIPESDPAFGTAQLTARKIAAITAWSNEVNEDAVVQMADLLAELYAEAIRDVEEDAFINSAVVGSEGLLTAAGVASTTMTGLGSFGEVTWDHLFAMSSAAYVYSVSEARRGQFIMHPSVWNVLRTSRPDTTAGYYLGNPSDSVPRTVDGYPVVLSNYMPAYTTGDTLSTKFIIFTDLSRHLIIGDRGGIRTEVAREGTVGANNLFEQDGQALRVVKRTANKVVVPAGVQVLTTAAA